MGTLFDAYGKKIKQLPAVYAKYDAAQTTVENAAYYSMASDYDADNEASPAVRATLRKRSRYEAGNNSWVKGMIATQAFDIIGTGPRLQVLTENSDLNNDLEADFFEWSTVVRLASKMHTMRMAQARDGEAFAILINNPKLPTKIKLDLQLIEADCIRGDYRDKAKERYVDGISYDKHGNPVSYNVLPHPGSGNISMKGVKVAADRVIHLFTAERPGQHRGVPELTSALISFAMLRRYTLAMIKKMETSANISGVIQTDEIDDESENVEPFEAFSMPRDAFAALPRGYRLQSHMLNNPTDSQSNFALQVKTELARALNLPKNVALGDSSSYNYASGRMDYQAYDKYLEVERMIVQQVVLSAIMRHFLLEFWALSNRWQRIDPLPLTWFWDGRAHVDPVKEARAQGQLLINGTTTLARECAKQGLDWEEVQDQRLLEEKREMERRRELGLPDKTIEIIKEHDSEEQETNRDEDD